MISETFESGGKSFKARLFPAPTDGKRHPVVLLLHGNFGLAPPYGDQIRGFAESIAELGYLTAVPQLYADEAPHPNDLDPTPHAETLSAAIAKVTARPDADPDRLGLVGFSLGAAAAMTYISSGARDKVKALADFFGPVTPAILAGVDKFPPTIIFHNKNDKIVSVEFSIELDRMLPRSIEHILVDPYDEISPPGNHAFRPGGPADRDSQKKAKEWLVTHVPPVGR